MSALVETLLTALCVERPRRVLLSCCCRARRRDCGSRSPWPASPPGSCRGARFASRCRRRRACRSTARRMARRRRRLAPLPAARARRRRGARLRRRRRVPRRPRAVRARLPRAAALPARVARPQPAAPTICARCCRASSPTSPPRFGSSSSSAVAAASGLLRPTIWLGDRHTGDAPHARRSSHEMWHVRARDPVVALRNRGRAARVLVEPAGRVPRTPGRADDRVDVRPPLRRAVRQDALQRRSSPRCCSPTTAPAPRLVATDRRGKSRRATVALARRHRCACAPAMSC